MRHSSLLALAVFTLTVGPRPEARAQTPTRPNIIVIMTDDQRWDTIDDRHGTPSPRPPDTDPVAMPLVDKWLVKHGVTFTNAYVVTPLCSPSRATLLTGQYAHTHGVRRNEDSNLFSTSLLPAWLQAGPDGYHTGLFGKYHNQYADPLPPGNVVDIPPGWNEWAAYKGQGQFGDPAYATCGQWPPLNPPANSDSPYICRDDASEGPDKARCERQGGYTPDHIAVEAVQFVNTAPSDKPFFLLFTPKAPHGQASTSGLPDPAICDAGHFDATPWPQASDPGCAGTGTGCAGDGPECIKDPPSYNECIENPPAWQQDQIAGTLDPALQTRRQKSLESLQSVDRAVDKLVAAAAARGNTYIIYTSDNGYLWGEHRLTAKGAPYHEASRVPLIIRPPAETAFVPRPESRLVLNVDLAPTILEIAGKTAPATHCLGGRSLVPLLQAAAPPATDLWRDQFVIEHFDFSGVPTYGALKSGNRKYVEVVRPGEVPASEREYYLAGDTAHELTNQGSNPTYAGNMDNLAARLRTAYPGWPVDEPTVSYIFGSNFECGLEGVTVSDVVVPNEKTTVPAPWTSTVIGGTLSADPLAALGDTWTGLQVTVNAAGAAVHVQNDTPNDESRYHARFHFDPNDFDPGPAVPPRPHGEVQLFFAGEEAPILRLVTVFLQKTSTGTYRIQARTRVDGGAWVDSPEYDITNGPHVVELEWQKATGPGANDGALRVWLDPAGAVSLPTVTLSGLDNDAHSVDFARLGAISVHDDARGTLFFDEFVSRRALRIGPR